MSSKKTQILRRFGLEKKLYVFNAIRVKYTMYRMMPFKTYSYKICRYGFFFVHFSALMDNTVTFIKCRHTGKHNSIGRAIRMLATEHWYAILQMFITNRDGGREEKMCVAVKTRTQIVNRHNNWLGYRVVSVLAVCANAKPNVSSITIYNKFCMQGHFRTDHTVFQTTDNTFVFPFSCVPSWCLISDQKNK